MVSDKRCEKRHQEQCTGGVKKIYKKAEMKDGVVEEQEERENKNELALNNRAKRKGEA